MAIGSLVGIAVVYLLGWLRLGLFLGGDFHKAFLLGGVAPFVPVDLVKAALAVLTAYRVRKAVDLG